MLRESHTIAKPQSAIFLVLLTLLVGFLALAPSGAWAFNFGFHRKAGANDSGGQQGTKPDAAQEVKPEEKAQPAGQQETKPDQIPRPSWLKDIKPEEKQQLPGQQETKPEEKTQLPGQLEPNPEEKAQPTGQQGLMPEEKPLPAGQQDLMPEEKPQPTGQQGLMPEEKPQPTGQQGLMPEEKPQPAGQQEIKPGQGPQPMGQGALESGEKAQPTGQPEIKPEKKGGTAGVRTAVIRTNETVPLSKPEDKASKPVERDSGVQPASASVIHRKDFSGRFSFVLPEGWGAYQIPYQVHDVLSLRENSKILATISFADELGRNSLKKLKEDTVENNKKLLQKFELVESSMLTLPNGQPCAKIVSLEQIEDVAIRQVQYILNLKKKSFLIVTLTVTKPIGPKYDKLVQEVVASISTNPNPGKLTK